MEFSFVIGETTTFIAPRGLTFLSNGECLSLCLCHVRHTDFWSTDYSGYQQGRTKDSLPSHCKITEIDKTIDACSTLQSFCCDILNPYTEFDAISGDHLLCDVYLLHPWFTGMRTPKRGSFKDENDVNREIIFGGLVNAGNPKLPGSALSDNDYLLFNFNDYPNGMVTLFNLLVMGNWQVWMQVIEFFDLHNLLLFMYFDETYARKQEGYKELTGTSWSLAYFISFYLITVLLLLNLVVAFVLEAFFAEMELEPCEREDESKEAGGRKNRPRQVGSKTRSQRVDALLHRILSAELKEAQCSTA
ncbi:hypothetical protein IFM89_025735 [Coptis chinensis]|uniref:Ion transport domain-containing protein n=1 Tax=Coptis chinensis TaxID=261450 RepID=A0A835I1M8_9MAGN|nr:hypothetical protein IFM89_025735 [Coptis chinensis]